MHIVDPQVTPGELGTPYSQRFGDIYFNPADGAAEVEHVFIQGNRLRERFAAMRPGARFVVGELGFGTGLNVRVLRDAFAACAPAGASLHVVSVEGAPLADGPVPRVPGVHRVDEALTLVHAQADEAMARWATPVDAWFLDGFAPAKNPAMWADDVLAPVGRWTTPGGTFATFTAAGAVRRGLQGAEFEVRKVPGFGRKREMLVGAKTGRSGPSLRSGPASVVVVGAGLAGALAADALRRRGVDVRVLDPLGPAGGASGNPQAVVEPYVEKTDTPRRRWYTSAFVYATGWLREAGLLHAGVERGPHGRKDAAWLRAAVGDMGWRDGLAFNGDALRSGLGGWCDPRAAVARALGGVVVERAAVTGVTRDEAGWRITTDAGVHGADAVVLACADAVARFGPTRHWPLQRVRGQLSRVRATDASAALGHVVTGAGYVCPATRDADGVPRHVVGASFHPNDDDPTVRDADHAHNRRLAEATAPAWADAMDWGDVRGRVGWRCATPDRMPMIGAVPGEAGLYAVTGLGSRGVLSAALGGELIADLMHGTPLPASADAAAAVSPGRFGL